MTPAVGGRSVGSDEGPFAPGVDSPPARSSEAEEASTLRERSWNVVGTVFLALFALAILVVIGFAVFMTFFVELP